MRMLKNICHIFSSLPSKIETSVLLKNIQYFLYTNHKSQNGKFLWLDNKTFVSFYFALFIALKTKTGRFHALIRHLFLVILICLWLQNPKCQVSIP